MSEIDTLTRLKQNVDSAYISTQDTRERSSDDWMFAHFNHWDEILDDYSDNEYRGQFDIITRPLRQIKGEMLANPISVRFRPGNDDEQYKEGAEILQGMYRASMRTNESKEAVDVAIDCQVSVGMGAWRVVTEYEDTSDSDDDRQVIKRVPIHEAHNVVFFDPQAKRRDKSDAKWCCILQWYTDDAYKALMEEYGEDGEDSNFALPSTSYVYPWNHGGRHYVGEYYELKESKRRVAILKNSQGDRQVISVRDSAAIEDLLFAGYVETARKIITERKVLKYLVTGERVLEGPIEIAGKHIPVVPLYGEWRFIEGQEWWEGMVRRAKDPQRLHNMSFSFIADQVGRSPRRKPIFTEDQVRGYEYMYQQDANYAYYLQNSKDAEGSPIPLGPINYMEGPTLSGTEVQFLQMTEKAVNDVMITQTVGENAISDGVTEGQLRLANSSNQMQTFIYQDALATAMRRDGEIFASIAAEIYDDERMVIVADEDDSMRTETINAVEYDDRTGMPRVKNDINAVKFDVYTDIGPRYQDKKEQAIENLRKIASEVGPQSEIGMIALLEYVSMLDIPGGDSIEKYANRQLLLMGLRKPETEEDMMIMQQAQQQKNPNADLAAAEAQARLMEGQAAMLDKQVDQFNAETKRLEAITKAEKTGVDINKAMAETEGVALENAKKTGQLLTGKF